MRVEARSGPYGRIYDPWIDEWSRAKLSATQMSIMCKLCERLEFDVEGNATAWYPRDEMARELGKTETAIRQAVGGLIKAGMLQVLKRGCRKHCTVYRVMPHMPWPKKKGVSSAYPKRGKGVSSEPQKGYPPDTPLRIKDGGPAHHGSPVRQGESGKDRLRELMRETMARGKGDADNGL